MFRFYRLSFCLAAIFASVCVGEDALSPRSREKLTQLQTLWGLLNPTKDLSSDFDVARKEPTKIDGLVDRIISDSPSLKKSSENDILLVNTGSRDRWGICFIGNAPKPDAPLTMYKNDAGNVLPIQVVDDPDGKTCSMYANFAYGERPGFVPLLGTMSLHRVEPQEVPKIPSSLSVNAETGEMENGLVKLVIDKQIGSIKSLKLKGTDHEFIPFGGLDDYQYFIQDAGKRRNVHDKGPFRLSVVASGPFAATLEIEAVSATDIIIKRRVTIFEDTEKIRIENFIENRSEKEFGCAFFIFPFNIPNGKQFVDTPEKLFETENSVMRKHEQIPFRRFAVFCNETLGVNCVPVDDDCPLWLGDGFASLVGKVNRSEYWIWPYAATFDVAVAQRFARQVRQPLIRLPGFALAAPKTAPLKFENEENVVIAEIRPIPHGNGALTVSVENVTENPVSTKIIPRSPYKKVYRSFPTGERLDEIDEIPLGPWKSITVRLE